MDCACWTLPCIHHSKKAIYSHLVFNNSIVFWSHWVMKAPNVNDEDIYCIVKLYILYMGGFWGCRLFRKLLREGCYVLAKKIFSRGIFDWHRNQPFVVWQVKVLYEIIAFLQQNQQRSIYYDILWCHRYLKNFFKLLLLLQGMYL